MAVQRIAPETFERVQKGVDHGSKGRVLARSSLGRLVWKEGFYWTPNSTSGREYVPAALVFYLDGSDILHPFRFFKGGRLTRSRVLNVMDDIKSFIGIPDLTAYLIIEAYRSGVTLLAYERDECSERRVKVLTESFGAWPKAARKRLLSRLESGWPVLCDDYYWAKNGAG